MNTKLAAVGILLLSVVIVWAFGYAAGYTGEQYTQLFFAGVGSGLVVALILFVSRAKMIASVKLAIAILLGVVLQVFTHFDDVRSAFEIREAQSLLTNQNDIANISALAEKHPSNRMLAVMDATWTNGKATREQVSQLLDQATGLSKQTDQPLVTMTSEQAAAAAVELKAALTKIRELETTVPKLYDAEYSATSAAIKKLKYPTGDAALKGLEKRHIIEEEYYSRLLPAYDALYSGLATQAEFFAKNDGKYDATNNAVMFATTEIAKSWDEIYAKVQQDAQALQALLKEGQEISQKQSHNLENALTK